MSALSFAAVLSLASYSPAFLWSPKGSSPAVEHLSAVSGLDVERTSFGLLGAGDPKRTEVRLVFLAEGLGTDAVRKNGGSLPLVHELLQTSASSVTMPFTTTHDATIFSDAVHVTAAEAEAYFKTNAKQLFGNGVADTVVIELPAIGDAVKQHLGDADALIGRITRAVDAGTGGNYAALLTAKRGALSHSRRLSKALPRSYIHTTPTLLTAQLIMLILAVIFLAGFCCLFSLQTPKRFEVNKEH